MNQFLLSSGSLYSLFTIYTIHFSIYNWYSVLFCQEYQNIILKMNRQRYSRQRSPPRNTLQLQEDHYRMKELLRTDLSMLEEENAILKLKCKKVSELEEKVELVLKQNSHLLTENEKMSRYLHQQKSQNELIRNKCQSFASQKVAMLGQFQHERKKLLRELQLLGDRVAEEEALKNEQISQIRSQFQVQLQGIKRQLKASEDSYELQIRKLREQLDKRQYEITQYANKLKRISNDADYEILRLKEQKEKLKNELIYCEEDRKKEIQLIKSKFQNNFLEEIESIKRTHLNNLQEMQMENDRIKKTLDDRLEETDSLMAKFNKQKNYYEDSITYLKRDLQSYKHKIGETQQLSNLEITQLKERLTNIHESQIQQIRDKQIHQLTSLQEEINRLQKALHNKNVEIEQLIKDKMSNRNIFDSEMMRMRDENNVLMYKLKDLEIKVTEMDAQLNNKIADREKHIGYLEEINRNLKVTGQSQQQALHKLLESLKQELSSEKMLFRENEQNYKEEISKLRNELSEAKNVFNMKESDFVRQCQELKNELSGTSNLLHSKLQSLNNKIKMIQKENQGLKNNIILKEKEMKNLLERIKANNERQTKLQGQIDDLRSKIIKREQKSNDSMNDQKGRLQNSFAFSIQNMKSDYDAALKLEGNKYRDLQEKLRKKESELEQLLRMYKKMTDEIQILTEQEANKKDITLKYPGATADLIATKNVFDVYLKTKVLDVCGDVLRENNKSMRI